MTFNTEIALDVEVEVLTATAATPGRLHDRPEHSEPPEPIDVELAVWLHGDDPDRRIDLEPWLPADVRDALTAEALERLRDARP
jgi:hypothetical protein